MPLAASLQHCGTGICGEHVGLGAPPQVPEEAEPTLLRAELAELLARERLLEEPMELMEATELLELTPGQSPHWLWRMGDPEQR